MFHFRFLAKKVHKKVFSLHSNARQGTQTYLNLTYAEDVDKYCVFCSRQIIIYHYCFFNCWQKRFSKKCFHPYLCPTWHTNTPKLNLCPRCCQKCSIKFNLIISMFGAKLSWCRIVWCQIILVPNCLFFLTLGAKLSILLCWCLIVRF